VIAGPFLAAFAKVYLSATPPWPLTLFLTAGHRRLYSRVFHLLTRLKLARLVAQTGAAGSPSWPSSVQQWFNQPTSHIRSAVCVMAAVFRRHAGIRPVALFHFRVQRFLALLQVRPQEDE